ncbi:interferon-induced very large GTPase 1-like [Gigaspora margarita]|uniref:Interferon-induced very large GTPase 1-like n=1 Tax=Gigaspora margarita TaxID=4874 RepID=A0A8H4AFW6_GIGMA|nr:interferon-induced very large GTPase 1-like [Gigaspora margarita]
MTRLSKKCDDTFIPYYDIKFIRKIKEENFSIIELAEHKVFVDKLFPSIFAVKAPKKDKGKKIIIEEIRKHNYFYCKNVINIRGLTESPNEIRCLIMDYVENGNLHKYPSNNTLKWEVKLKMSIDIAKGLLECHDHDIIHLNINSENILVDKNLELKIAGFGFNKNVEFSNEETVRWAAPEYISELQKMDEKMLKLSDIYSCGLVIWEIAVNGIKPFDNMKSDTIKDAKASGDIKNLIEVLKDKDTPGKLEKLIIECCDSNSAKRPTLAEVKFNLNSLYYRILWETRNDNPEEQALFYFSEEKYEDLVQHLTNILKANENNAFALKYRDVIEKWHEILGEELPLIRSQNYNKLGKTILSPKLSSSEIRRNVAAVLPYILQKVKMWGVDILKAENFDNLNYYEENDESSDDESNGVNKRIIKKNTLSRFDCIAALFASAECTVVQDIFQTMSQFPIAFPLLIPELVKEKMYKVMLPLFTGAVIKWKTSNGAIVENHLFKDSFKMIVTVRVGKNRIGKSTIINQLLNSKYMFTSCSEPGAEYRIPHMINGSIEFVWLTEETCGDALWNLVFKNHYEKRGKDIILLVNLHDPRNNENIDIKKYTINTNSLEKRRTLKKLCRIFEEVLTIDFGLPIHTNNELKLGKTLEFAENIETFESRNIVKFIKNKTCSYIKLNVMQLQKKQFKAISDCLQFWQQTTELQELIQQFVSILALPINVKKRALAHFEKEISKLSMEESFKHRNNAILKRNELSCASIINTNHEKIREISKEIAKLWEEVDNTSLGIEHFFRELRYIYKIFISDYDNDSKIILDHVPIKENILKLPEYCAELLTNGYTIELLDSDSTAISEDWFLAICNCINKKFPNLRVFVISIIGLQSSGKSTLLNALFASKFSVSAGRYTEGFAAPEKIGDPESEKKDRMLATFAMGISNLTIINILGESISELTKILQIAQIAIVTRSRLEKDGMSPDILVVQHVTEKNATKLSWLAQIFREAFQGALKIVKEKDAHNFECLNILDERIKSKTFLKLFSPFKNGTTAYSPPSKQYCEDVINLYDSIINVCENSQSKKTFSDWYPLIKSSWDVLMDVADKDYKLGYNYQNEIGR